MLGLSWVGDISILLATIGAEQIVDRLLLV